MKGVTKHGEMMFMGLLVLVLMTLNESLADGYAQEDKSPIQHLLDRNVEVRWESARQIRANYEATVLGLVRIVSRSNDVTQIDDDSKLLAVELLGDMRAAEAVDVLVANINLIGYSAVIHTTKKCAGSPCADALIKIGKPGSRGCLNALGATLDERKTRLLVEVIREVEGDRFGKMMVLEAAQKESDANKKANFEKAAKSFQKIFRDSGEGKIRVKPSSNE